MYKNIFVNMDDFLNVDMNNIIELPESCVFNLNIVNDLEKIKNVEKSFVEETIENEKKKRVTFFNTVSLIIIPNKETLDILSIWYSRYEFNHFRNMFNREITKLVCCRIAENRTEAYKKLCDPLFEENDSIKKLEKCPPEISDFLVGEDY